MEAHGFFQNRRGRRLYFAAHGDAGVDEVWVFCNPFLEEKVFSQPVYVAFARALAARGAAALRFDYEGDGDSEGGASELSLAEWGEDLADACAFARSRLQARAVGLFGLRLGGSLAWLHADAVDARRLLAWDPVVDGADYFQACLRLNLTTQLATYKRVVESREQLMQRLDRGETVNIAGYEVGARMARSLAQVDLREPGRAPSCPVRVVQFLRPGGVPAKREADFPARAANVRVDALPVQPFWQESKHYDPAPERLLALSLEEALGVQQPVAAKGAA